MLSPQELLCINMSCLVVYLEFNRNNKDHREAVSLDNHKFHEKWKLLTILECIERILHKMLSQKGFVVPYAMKAEDSWPSGE